MRVLICPDSFTGTLSASEAALAIREGWLATSPADDITLCPLSDGGPGFASAMAHALGGEAILCEVQGPAGDKVSAQWTKVGATAFIESAEACGMHLVENSTIWQRTTYGVGQLIAQAIDAGCTHVVVGLGGSGTNDAGIGALLALGAVAHDVDGKNLSDSITPERFQQIESFDVSKAQQRTAGITIEIATDVDNPLLGLRGASREYGPQKGATDIDVIKLEAALEHIHGVLGRKADGKDPAVALGAGAAGGLGYGLMWLGGVRTPGISRIHQALGFEDLVADADIIVTGEGHFDWQSLRGKVVHGVAEVALNHAVPVVVVAGQVSIGRRDWGNIGVSAAYSMSEDVGLDESITHAFDSLRLVAARAAKTWARG
ncbi:MAG: hypothetical protein RIS43_908 [Actinomycetota bacterium]